MAVPLSAQPRWALLLIRLLAPVLHFCLPPMLSSCRLRYLCVELVEAECPTPPQSKRYGSPLGPYQLNDILSRWYIARERALGSRIDQNFCFVRGSIAKRLCHFSLELVEAECPTPTRSKRYGSPLGPYQLNDIVSRWYIARERALGSRIDQNFGFNSRIHRGACATSV